MTMIQMNKKIILASNSPRRKELLEMMKIDFVVEPSNYEEDMTINLPTNELAQVLSLGKATDVYNKHVGEKAIIIGADTFVSIDGELLGKPKNESDAFHMLKKLSDKTHLVITGLCVIDCETGKQFQFSDTTEVRFKKLTDNEINNYIDTKEPLDKAGSYAIQGQAAPFIESINGDFYIVVGLPLRKLFEILYELNAFQS